MRREHPCYFLVSTSTSYEYENLEKLEVTFVGDFLGVFNESEKPWPKLRGLILYPSGTPDIIDDQLIELLLNQFFRRTQRPTMQSIAVDFIQKPSLANMFVTSDFFTPFPNLSYLSLEEFIGNDNFFNRLWERLPNLQHVSLFNCPNLNDNGFIGHNSENPAIFQLFQF